MQATREHSLKSKDLITIAIFSVLLAFVFFVSAMIVGMTPLTYPFLAAFMVIPGGIDVKTPDPENESLNQQESLGWNVGT